MSNSLRTLPVGAALLAATAVVHAAAITWDPAVNTADKLDLVEGVVVTALSGGTASPTVSGGGANGLIDYSFAAGNFTTVTFVGTGGDAGDTARARTNDNVYAPAITTTGDTDYDNLIDSLSDANGAPSGIVTGTLTLDGLNVGSDYKVQIFFNDQRTCCNGRVMRYGDGLGSTVDVAASAVAGAQTDDYGQFAVGSFTADAATQDITLEALGFGNVHFNAVLVVDVTKPLAFLSSADGDPVAAPFTLDVGFTDNVTGLEATDFVIANGTASNVTPAAGPASAYTVTITPTTSGLVTVDLPADSVANGNSQGNFASNSLEVYYIPAGADQPTVTLSTTATPPVYGPYPVDLVFSENVTGLEDSDFIVVGGTASGVSGSGANYTVTITPTPTGTIGQSVNVEVTLPFDSVVDDADNLPNEESTPLITEYIVPSVPTVELFNPVTGPIVSGTYTVDVWFTEDVTGLDVTDFVVTNGTASNLVTTDPATYTVDITPTAIGLVRVQLPAGSVDDVDGEGQVNPDSNLLSANNLPAGTWTSGVVDLSSENLGAGESQGFFDTTATPKVFDSISDSGLNDIPWTDGVLSGTFDLSIEATSSKIGIKRGGRGAFGTADIATAAALVNPGATITLGSLVVSDLQGDLAGASITNIKIVAVYLGNETAGDGATINGLVADGAATGITSEAMRNDIDLADSAEVEGTGTIANDGYSINGLDITFETALAPPVVKVVSADFNASNEFVVTFSGLDTGTTYELRHSPDLVAPFTLVPGTSKMPAGAIDSFTDPSPSLPGPGFYQLWLTP